MEYGCGRICVMQIPTRLWADTAIKHTMDGAVAEIAALLEPCSRAEWERVGKHPEAVLYRYWHKEKANSPSPAHLAEMIARDEGWQEGGVFVPTLTIKEKRVEMKVDYLPYFELPVYADARVKTPKYHLGKSYNRLISWIRNTPEWNTDKSLEATVFNAKLLWEGALDVWYEGNPMVRVVFAHKEWRSFWVRSLQNWAQLGGESTDILMDRYVERMRDKYPHYGLTNDELGRLDKKREKLTRDELLDWKAQYYFWMELSMYVVYPLTLYAGLLSPIFMDQKLWEDDILALTKKEYSEPMPIYGPCSNIATTELGRLLALSYRSQNEREKIWV